MIVHILFALGLASVTVIVHAFGTSITIAHLVRLLQHTRKHELWTAGIQIARVVGALLLLHLIEAGIWALFYLISGDLPDFETAIYFSITSYTTVGYGDVVLPTPWRILGPSESAVGILMFGWSTAIIVAAVTRIHGGRLRLLAEQNIE
jgi:voltage-gated potassium channel